MERLRERTDVQNFDLMNRAGFSQNHLSRYHREAADLGHARADSDAREIVHGMPYERWKALHHRDAT
jgi:hypothetical protein